MSSKRNTSYVKLFLFYETYDDQERQDEFFNDLEEAAKKEGIKYHYLKIFKSCELFYYIHKSCKKNVYKSCDLPAYFFRDLNNEFRKKIYDLLLE